MTLSPPRRLLCLLFLMGAALACQAPPSTDDDSSTPWEWPEPSSWEANQGPGAPQVSFAPEALFQNCAFLDGGSEDHDHHNLVALWDGYLVMPWAPEWSGGGVSFFDFTDPCFPVLAGQAEGEGLRESHSIAFSRGEGSQEGRSFMVLNDLLGVQFWEVSDVTQPRQVSRLTLDGVFYPDAYMRVVLSVFWQGAYVYAAAADNGFFVIDATDPEAPLLVSQYLFDPPLRLSALHLVGNTGIAFTAEGSRTVLLDLGDPFDPQVVPGGDFEVHNQEGSPMDYYFGNVVGGTAWFARKEAGGGPIAYDIRDPSNPIWLGEYFTIDGNGGYVFANKQFVFTGDSNYATVVDFSFFDAPVLMGTADLQGDVDTFTPFGNVAILSVDDEAVDGQASAVVPWAVSPDVDGPVVEWHQPADGATWQPLTSRVGLSFDEMVDMASVFPGSVRMESVEGKAVMGRYNAQEAIANFTPLQPLEPDTTYIVRVPQGGVVDQSGNPTEGDLEFRFSTGGTVQR